MSNSFGARSTLKVDGKDYTYYRLDALADRFDVASLPFSLKVLLENLLRAEAEGKVERADVEALAGWQPRADQEREIDFRPARVLLQDFTGVPCVVDLAAMRDAMEQLGGDPTRINPLQPVELVIDHSVQVDAFGTAGAFKQNAEIEFERNQERYAFLRWGQGAFANLKVVPPDTGIVHQVNIEHLARVVFVDEGGAAYPDTLVGTDSHTTMVNGLGVLGWGVGGIEAEAAMLGQAVSMLIPDVVGFELTGKLKEGTTATDLVLTVTQMLRKKGVVGKFVEFFGPGLENLALADRATIANMAPEYGATCGIFPVDEGTLAYLELTGRSKEQIALVKAYCQAQGMWREAGARPARYSDTLALDMATVEPCLAGPKRPQDRVALTGMKRNFDQELPGIAAVARGQKDGGGAATAEKRAVKVRLDGQEVELSDGAVVIAAITSCTNTSNPRVMIGAGLVAQKAAARGLTRRPWVKTSLAPGSKAVTEYLREAGLVEGLEALGFHTVGYGCTTCIGNSGPLIPEVEAAVPQNKLVVASVLSGNRNFEGRVHRLVRMNYLASPPLVVAYALAGRVDIDLETEPLGHDRQGQPVYLRDVWPTQDEVVQAEARAVQARMFSRSYAGVYEGDENWRSLEVPTGDRYVWDDASTYIARPPFFEGMGREAPGIQPIRGARALAVLGDSVTTDHISPAGGFAKDSPAGRYLVGRGVDPKDFNSYGARRGHHEVMMRGTFANVRLRNLMAPGTEGGVTRHMPSGEQMSIFDASERYRAEGTPLVVLAGKEYGTGSSRDWAAKGPALLGVRVVIAQSYERIHRSNLVGMGILPLEFREGESAQSLGLGGEETYEVQGFTKGSEKSVTVAATGKDGKARTFQARVRLDTPQEVEYYRHGGILHYVLRQIAVG